VPHGGRSNRDRHQEIIRLHVQRLRRALDYYLMLPQVIAHRQPGLATSYRNRIDELLRDVFPSPGPRRARVRSSRPDFFPLDIRSTASLDLALVATSVTRLRDMRVPSVTKSHPPSWNLRTQSGVQEQGRAMEPMSNPHGAAQCQTRRARLGKMSDSMCTRCLRSSEL
jgi:hypothetical protein